MLLVGDATGHPSRPAPTSSSTAARGDTDDPAVPNLVKTAGLATNLYLGNDGDGITLSVGISNGSVIPCGEVVDGVSWENGGTADVTAMSSRRVRRPGPAPGYANGGADGLMTLQRCPDGADTDNSAGDFIAHEPNSARPPTCATPFRRASPASHPSPASSPRARR